MGGLGVYSWLLKLDGIFNLHVRVDLPKDNRSVGWAMQCLAGPPWHGMWMVVLRRGIQV